MGHPTRLRTTRPQASEQARNPVPTARLIGGPAHAHTCPIPQGHGSITLTIISGHPEPLDLADPHAATELLQRAGRTWHTYAHIQALTPDHAGLIAFRTVRELPDTLEDFLSSIWRSPDTRPETHAARWQTLEHLLTQTGLGINVHPPL